MVFKRQNYTALVNYFIWVVYKASKLLVTCLLISGLNFRYDQAAAVHLKQDRRWHSWIYLRSFYLSLAFPKSADCSNVYITLFTQHNGALQVLSSRDHCLEANERRHRNWQKPSQKHRICSRLAVENTVVEVKLGNFWGMILILTS